jgi:16S rRNA (uracil1498-N3)-methyltransferase
MADRFFTTQPLDLGEVSLEGPESHHLSAVRRFDAGDMVTLFNGDGREFIAEILATDRKRTTLLIREVRETSRELPHGVTIAAALPKGDRAEFMIEKLTELGVTTFVPLITTRSVVVPKESTIEKLSRTVIEASKQCGRNRLMAIEPAVKFTDFVTNTDGPRLILHPGDETAARPTSFDKLTLAIGPEGGFTPDEVAAATGAGFQTMTFGSRILRIETAAIAAAVWAGNQGERRDVSPPV